MVAPQQRREQGAAPVCNGVEARRCLARAKATVEAQYNELMQGRLRDAVLRGVLGY